MHMDDNTVACQHDYPHALNVKPMRKVCHCHKASADCCHDEPAPQLKNQPMPPEVWRLPEE